MRPYLLYGLLTGLLVNICDVSVTLLFAADAWTAVLTGWGIPFNPLTPPSYILVSFIGGTVAFWLYTTLRSSYGRGPKQAAWVALLVWGMTRLYGAGHVVMGQMPLWIFLTMSAGLLLGYVLGLQVSTRLYERQLPKPAPSL
jgi:hypothetical protein